MVTTISERSIPRRPAPVVEPSPAPRAAPEPARAPGVRERSAAAGPTAPRASAASLRGDLDLRAAHVARAASPVPLDPAARASAASSSRGPRNLHLGAGWTPQGQGYDAKRGEVLTTYYRGHDVLLSVQDKKSGKENTKVRLGGLGPNAPGGPVPGPSHGGGVSTDGKNVYVADTDRIYVYSRSAIEAAERRGEVARPSQVMPVPKPSNLRDPATGIGLVSAGSYMTVKDGYAYVGAYSKEGDGKTGAVWRYKLDDKSGKLLPGSRQGPIRAPDRAQGVTVVDGALLFTTGARELMYQPIDTRGGRFRADIDKRVDISNGRIDPYAQGLNVIDGELWVTYESGADAYRDKVDHPREHIQRIPLRRLDLAEAGLRVGDLT